MKKFFSLLLCVVMLLSLAACGVNDEPQKEVADSSGESAAQEETKQEKTTFGLNETAVFKDLKFTAIELVESNGEEFFEPAEGKVFVGVKFTIENISDENQNISTMLLFDGYVDDVKCDYSISAAVAFDEGTLDGELAPGKKLIGWYPLEVPAGWKNIELEVQSSWLSSSSATFVFTK